MNSLDIMLNNKKNNNIENNYNIDERINKICENAEKEYTQSQHKKNNNDNYTENGIPTMNSQQYYINNRGDNQINNPLINKEDHTLFLSESYSNIAKINNKSLDKDINVLSKINLGSQNVNNKKKSNNFNTNYNNISSPFNKPSDNYNKKLALYNLNKKDVSKSKSNDNKNENKITMDLSKILLESRDLIKKLKIKQAYILLKKTISTGIKHSDLFYLYGEVNRLIKQYKTSEDYLLKAVKFELHSPYAFYSLGILYQELKEYQNSNKFFNLFYRLMDNADLHLQMAINYFYMKDYVNAADEISKAIDIDRECAEYYQFRSEIYKKMGLKEMENEDFNMYWYIIQKRKEEQ